MLNFLLLTFSVIAWQDHLLELLTVEENLWFASKIKNPEYGFDHVKNIERVIISTASTYRLLV